MNIINSLKWLCGIEKENNIFHFDEEKFLNSSILEETQEITLKEQTLNSQKIKKYLPKETDIYKKIIYEPETLKDYIGQIEAKEQIKTAIKIIKELRPIHILINGWAGCGKTLLAKITSKLLNANFIYRVPEQLRNMDDFLSILNQIQENEQLTVFMLDEIHTIDTKLVNILLPILQDFQYEDIYIRPFVMIGATTDKDKLVKKQSPLVSRFQIQITLDKYKVEDLIIIISNYKNMMYSKIEINNQDYKTIAENSRGIPRGSIALLLKLLVIKDITNVLSQSNIIKDGITKIDLKILQTLSENFKPMGSNYLSQAVGISQSDFENIYERYLIEKGYIIRQARGRTISEKGKVFLNELKG